MEQIKKIGILAGAVVGGVIGGGVSMVGKLSGVKLIDEIGESIVDSGIYTGAVAGNIASGTVDVLAGKLTDDSEKLNEGVGDLKTGGRQIVDNLVDNVKLIAENSGDIVTGAVERDGEKVVRGARTLAKTVAVGAITVGAIRIKKSGKDADK